MPAENPKTAAAHRKMRNFAKEHEIKLYEGKGVCHQIMVENHVCPGEFIMGADSHTCTYGALGAFGTGIGCTDFLYAMVTGQSVSYTHLHSGITIIKRNGSRSGIRSVKNKTWIIGADHGSFFWRSDIRNS